MKQHIRIGSRRSRLAQRQAHLCREQLVALLPDDYKVEVLTFQTSGDAYLAGNVSEIGNKGLFTKEIEAALLRDEIDIAVHSMKDVATRPPDGLVIPSVLKRDDVRDVLLCQDADSINTIPHGATLGTSSLRRAVQIRYLRPDISIVAYRGNLDRRISRLESGEVDASLLAAAGLERLDMTLNYAHPISIDVMLPAVAQGVIGLQCRANDIATYNLITRLNHADTMHAITTERHFLQVLDGTCRTPIAGYATIESGTVYLRGMLANTRGSLLVQDAASAPIEDYARLATNLAHKLRDKLAKARASEHG